MKSEANWYSSLTAGVSNRFGRFTPLPLRLIVGFGFLSHGYSKLIHGPENFAAILRSIGVPSPEIMSWATISVELLGGFAVLIGAFVALASVPMTIVLLTAIFTVHLPYGFNSVKLLAVTPEGAKFGPVGYEVNLLYIACLVALVLSGSGPLSVDEAFRSSRKAEDKK